MNNKKKTNKGKVKSDLFSNRKNNDILIYRKKYNMFDTIKQTPANMKKNGVIDL